MYDMREAITMMDVNEKTLRRYIKRFNLNIKRGLYNKYVFEEKDIQVMLLIKSLLKSGLSDNQIKEKIKEFLNKGEVNEFCIKNKVKNKNLTNPLNLPEAVNKEVILIKNKITEFTNTVAGIHNDMNKGLKSVNESINNLFAIMHQQNEILKQQKEIIHIHQKQNELLMRKVMDLSKQIKNQGFFKTFLRWLLGKTNKIEKTMPDKGNECQICSTINKPENIYCIECGNLLKVNPASSDKEVA